MKILVIFTGGTIGSAVSDGWISPSADMKYLLLEKYREITGDDTEFSTLNPYTILSENLSSENLNSLIETVSSNIDFYDGIIVTHGSDTLQYAGSALSYAFGCKCIPIVAVASNYPIEDERANGIDNFIGAVEFIKSQSGRGVFISYKNKDNPVHIHRATRTICHMEANDELFSIDSQPFAYFDGKITINKNYKHSDNCTFVKNAVFCENSGILTINVLPGESYNYDLSQYNAVILKPYHSGTLNTASENFRNFCKSAKIKGVPVFVVNAAEGVTYSSSKEFESLGVIALPMCSFPAIYMKIWLGVSKNVPLEAFVMQSVTEELHNYI